MSVENNQEVFSPRSQCLSIHSWNVKLYQRKKCCQKSEILIFYQQAILNLFNECCPVQYVTQSCFSRRNLFLVMITVMPATGDKLIAASFYMTVGLGYFALFGHVKTLHVLRWLWNTEDSHLLVEFSTETTDTEFSGLVISLLTVRHKLARS